MSEHDQDQRPSSRAIDAGHGAAAAQQHAASTPGGRILGSMIAHAHGSALPTETLAKLFAKHPADAQAMFAVLQAHYGMARARELMTEVDKPRNTAPAAAQVDGVNTGSRVHYDDDSATVMTVGQGKWIGGYDKDNQRATGGHVHTDTEHDGDDTDVKSTTHEASVGKQANGGYGAGYTQKREHEHEDHGVTTKTGATVGAYASTGGFGAQAGFDKGVKIGETGRSIGGDLGAGIDKDGHFEGDVSGKIGRDKDGGGSTAFAAGAGYKDQTASANLSAQRDKVVGKDNDGKDQIASDKITGSVRYGEHGIGGDFAATHKSGGGTASSASFGGDIGHDGMSGHAGYSMMTKEGTGAHASVSHGTKVTAGSPVLVDGTWHVSYVRATSTGGSAGGSLGGGGASIGIGGGTESTAFESGTKVFTNFVTAMAFQQHAAEELGEPVIDPATAIGALQIPIGETVGGGKTTELDANGSLAFEGAKLGVSASERTTNELDITRVDTRHVDVTVTEIGGEYRDHSIAGNGLSDTVSTSKDRGNAVTWRFDLFDTASQAAFQKMCADKSPPAPGTATKMSTERVAGHQSQDDIKLAGHDHAYTGSTSEKHVTTKDGTRDNFHGAQAEDMTAGWLGSHLLGDVDAHSSMAIDANVKNGKSDGYTATMRVDGESGEHNREAMGKLFMLGNGNGDAKASGKWKLTTEIDESTIHAVEQLSLFKLAKTDDDKRRVLTEWVAKSGPFAIAGMSASGDKAMDWDVELDGDPNFPGRDGRLQLAAKIAAYHEQLRANPDHAPAILGAVNQLETELMTRQLGISNPARYTDLPQGLRDKQLEQVQRELTAVRGLYSVAQIDALAATSKSAAATGHEDPQLATVHGRIDAANVAILRDAARVGTASAAVKRVTKHSIAGHGDANREALGSTREHWQLAANTDRRSAELDRDLEAARTAFLAHGDLASGETLAKLSEDKATFLAIALDELIQAATELKPVTTPSGIAGHEAFWASIPGTVGAVETDQAAM